MNDLPTTIHILGCSWSRNSVCKHYPWKENKTLSWSEMLALDMNQKYKFRNWSMNGNSNNLILAQTERVLRDCANQDMLLIIQFTRPLRQTFAKDFESISNHMDANKLQPSHHDCLKNYDYKELPYSSSYNWEFNEFGFCMAHPGKLVQSGGAIKQTYENNLLHLVDVSKISETLHTEAIQRHCKLLCERAKVPYILYSHVDAPEADNSHLDFIVHRDWLEMEDYWVDPGYHLSAEGNRILLDKFIKPCIDTKI